VWTRVSSYIFILESPEKSCRRLFAGISGGIFAQILAVSVAHGRFLSQKSTIERILLTGWVTATNYYYDNGKSYFQLYFIIH
jgi:hypothetical protein